MHVDQAVLTSLATLLGAGVGGFTTYMSSRAAFHRGETLETRRRHDALMRDVSVRFVKSLDIVQGEISSSKFNQLSAGFDELVSSNQEVKKLFERVKVGASVETDGQAVDTAPRATEPTPLALEQIAAVTFRAALRASPHMVELNSIIAEMKLIMPNHILQKAQYAAIVTLFAAHISEAGTPNSYWNQASSAAVSDFVEAVRTNFGLNPTELT
ncbi:hypothetical protein [Mycobacterium shigaense]|uniref:Uncharacterized protein n=1 Tax=Mycobacterium shigaense TaxID=722731 RepID=A0A1Z4EKZ7_9MYCO|nr:hypothetical protein [Mycobacterium shigaense]MEA1125022.1 hypothetical protein [Mycobacterium shigaense]PRI13462.1 hypothetical protein B2J96_20730 [Mycobacterium shigaense]BAX93628.1 hypothetical protein MSG_03496 [Mycobacterium shigaense]